jgi:hypothetical protein
VNTTKLNIQNALSSLTTAREELFESDADGDIYCVNKKLERKLRRIIDMLKAML